MAFLHKLNAIAYLAGGKYIFYVLLTAVKMVQMTLSDGVCDLSSVSFVTLGTLALLTMGDVDTALYIGERGQQMQEKGKSEVGKA
eukprot:11742595-Ditylum_brightwellii.AAC.1